MKVDSMSTQGSNLGKPVPELAHMILRPFSSSLRLLGGVIAVMLVLGYFGHWASSNSTYQQLLQGFYGPEMRARVIDGRWSDVQLLCERIGKLSEVGRIRFVREEAAGTPVCDVVVDTPRAWTLVNETEIPFGFSKDARGELGVLKVQRFDHRSLPLLALFMVVGSALYLVVTRMWMRQVQATISNHVRSVQNIVQVIREGENGASRLAESVRDVSIESREMQVIRTSIAEYLEKAERLQALEVKSAKDVAQKEMLRQLAHDLRSPLSSLKLISGTKKFFSDMKAQQVLSAAVDAIQRQLEQAMSATRENHGRTTATVSELRGTLQEIVQMNRMAHPWIEFVLDADEGTGICAVNREELRRVLQNLVTNSRENLESITGHADPRIEIGLRVQQESLVFVVRDNGSGLPAVVMSDFGRKGLSVGKRDGNGLGLAGAAAFAGASHGEIEVSSSTTEGTEIRILIPAEISPTGISSGAHAGRR